MGDGMFLTSVPPIDPFGVSGFAPAPTRPWPMRPDSHVFGKRPLLTGGGSAGNNDNEKYSQVWQWVIPAVTLEANESPAALVTHHCLGPERACWRLCFEALQLANEPAKSQITNKKSGSCKSPVRSAS